jgi:hexosaminidase
MHRRFIWFAVGTFLLALSQVAEAGRSAGVAAGDVALSFGPDRGLTISFRGEPILEGMAVNFHDGQWKHVYYSLPAQVQDVQVVETAEGKSLRVLGGPAEGGFRAEYQATVRPDGSVHIQLSYTRDREQAFGLEYNALQLAEAAIVGCPFVGKGGPGAREGKVQLEATTRDINEVSRVVDGVQELTIQSRVGKVTFATDGEPWLQLFDGRLRFSGSPTTGWFWGGKLGDAAKVGETRHLDLTVRFDAPPAAPAPTLDLAGKGAPAAALPHAVTPAAQAGLPVLVPAPKEVSQDEGAFALRADTPVVVRDGPAPEDLRAARALQQEAKERFGLGLPVRQAHEVRGVDGTIVLGEAASPLVAKGMAGLSPVEHEEGYVLSVTPRRIVVAGRDRAGTYWGVQTLVQLLRQGARGPEAPAATVRDWPDFKLRAAHLCLGEHPLDFCYKLIDRVLARRKLNAVVLEIESIRWDSHPEWAPKGPTPAQVGQLAQYAREHFLEPIPQIQSGGHCDYWLFKDGRHKDLAENPENPYNYCPSNPALYQLLFQLYEETEKAIHPRYFHIGHDEMNGDYGICPRCKGKPPAELLAGDVTKLRDWWAQRHVQIMMWGDLLLAPLDVPGGTDAFNGGGPLQLSRAVPLLPRDVIIGDWHYGGGYEHFPSFDLWQKNGFQVVAGPWYGTENIWNITRDAAKHGFMGVMGTTWCGVASEDQAVTDSVGWLAPLIYAADCSWSVGQRPCDKLPYDVIDLFLDALLPPTPSRDADGYAVDLAAAGTRALADPDGNGWLGYGPGRDLATVPTGRVVLGGEAFAVASKAVVLAGRLAPPGLPAAVNGIAVGCRASSLLFLHTCGWPTGAREQVGLYRVHYADGSVEEAPLVYGKNIAALYAPRPAAARVAWRGKTAGGAPISLETWEWRNPHPEKEIASLDVVSAGGRAGPALLGVTAVAP